MKLHEAMIEVIKEKGKLSSDELAKIIDDRRLYMKKDFTELKGTQVRARARQYPKLFILEDNLIDIR